MKKFELIIFLMCVIFTIQGQTLPKKVVLKGSSELTGFYSTDNYEIGSNSVEIKTTQINFQPSIGKFISHYFLLGIYTEYGYKNQKEYYEYGYDNNSSESKSFTIGPYFRAYLADLKYAPFFHVNIGYSRHTIEPSVKMDGIDYDLGVGMEYFANKKFTFEFLINYSYLFVRDYIEEANDAVSIKSKGLEFRIGTSIILN